MLFSEYLKRKEGDSNPRYGYPYDSLANCWFQPLTHPSLLTQQCGLFQKDGGKDRPVFHLHKCLTSAPSLQTSADISRPSSPPKADRRAMTRAYDRVGNADRLTRRPSIRPSSEVVRALRRVSVACRAPFDPLRRWRGRTEA